MTTTVAASFPSISREYVWVPVTAKGDDADQLTTLPVEMAFLADRAGEPTEDDWHAGDWAPTGTVARCLLGPTLGVHLDAGTWWVWVRVTGAVERPARKAGPIKVT